MKAAFIQVAEELRRATPTKAEVEAAGQAWAQRRAEKPIPVTYAEPVRYRPALTKCLGCSSWIPETVPAGRHGVRWMNVEGAPVLVNCSNREVQP